MTRTPFRSLCNRNKINLRWGEKDKNHSKQFMFRVEIKIFSLTWLAFRMRMTIYGCDLRVNQARLRFLLICSFLTSNRWMDSPTPLTFLVIPYETNIPWWYSPRCSIILNLVNPARKMALSFLRSHFNYMDYIAYIWFLPRRLVWDRTLFECIFILRNSQFISTYARSFLRVYVMSHD